MTPPQRPRGCRAPSGTGTRSAGRRDPHRRGGRKHRPGTPKSPSRGLDETATAAAAAGRGPASTADPGVSAARPRGSPEADRGPLSPPQGGPARTLASGRSKRGRSSFSRQKPFLCSRQLRTSTAVQTGGWAGCCKRRAHWTKLGAASIAPSHWLGCGGPWEEKERPLRPAGGNSGSAGGTPRGSARPLLASWRHPN